MKSSIMRLLEKVAGTSLQFQPDQPSFFIPWREQFRGDIEIERHEQLVKGYNIAISDVLEQLK